VYTAEEKKSILFILAAYLLIQFLTFRTGVGGEGLRDIVVFKQVNSVMIPYQHIVYDYGILGPYIWSFIIGIFGSELITLRFMAILMGLIGIPFIYDISKKIMSEKFALLASFLGFSLFYFPNYSFNHYPSIVTNVITLWYACKFFCNKKEFNLVMWGMFMTMTFYIRHIPTGIALIFASLFVISIYSLKEKTYYKLSRNLLLLFSPFVITSILLYFLTSGSTSFVRLFKYNLMLLGKKKAVLPVLGLPHSIEVILNFFNWVKKINFNNNIETCYKIISFLNIISAHLIEWLIFIIPTLYLAEFFIKIIIKKEFFKMEDKNYFIIFLCLLNIPLFITLHNNIIGFRWPTTAGGAFFWSWLGLEFTIQPGLIAFLYLLYKLKMPKAKYLLTRLTAFLLVFSLILVPKAFSMRYLLKKMPVGRVAGIRGIYLEDYYKYAVVPAVEYINNRDNNMPGYILTADFKPEFYLLCNKKMLIPEWIGITLFLSDEWGADKDIQYIFPGKKKMYYTKEELNDVILERIKDKKPCIVHVSQPLKNFKERNAAWVDFVNRNYRIAEIFTYKRLISDFTDDDPTVTIYLPK